MDEAKTRSQLIDRDLTRGGWSGRRRRPLEEVLVRVRSDARESRGYVDYVLLGDDGNPLAIVEAKRTSRDALAGKRQAEEYAGAIFEKTATLPFIYLTNGREIHFWDSRRYPPRLVAGFHAPADLARLAHQHRYGIPLRDVDLDAKIAGRSYQIEAIRRVTESVEAGKRHFLLVMTGTGKTRTTIALVDLLLRAKRVQRVLFLADRRELVRQAMTEFKTHLPHESLARIEAGEASTARIQFATYPSMMQVYESLPVGHYDLIISDESHRSIYQRYKALFDHFDAMRLGLTATPTDFIDHNTFSLFDCDDGIPTFLYSYEQAVAEGNLVTYRVLDAQTHFQISGIQGGQLPEPLKQMARDQGVDPEELDFDGTDIEKNVINQGTNDAIVREFMARSRRDALGLPHKTIVFAVSHAHARRLYESFNRLYPELQSRGFAEIIDSHMERADALLADFKSKDMPRIALSVDMLDTGVDVPAIQNLVFAKPVFSRVKFWQMVGRGTRLHIDWRTGEAKVDFLIMDLWRNFAYFQLNPEGEKGIATEPLPVKLFRVRLHRWQLESARGEAAERTIQRVRDQLRALPVHSVDVRPHLDEIGRLLSNWPAPLDSEVERLSLSLAPLLRLVFGMGLAEVQFRVWCERGATACLLGEQQELHDNRAKIREALGSLPRAIPEVRAKENELERAASDSFWANVNVQTLDQIQDGFASLMRFRMRQTDKPIEINLPDRISARHWVIYGPTGEGAFADTYRKQVEALVRRLADDNPSLAKLKRGESLQASELDQLAATLNQADLFITTGSLQAAFDTPTATFAELISQILRQDARLPNLENQISAAFDKFVADHPRLRANQLAYLRAVKAALLRHGTINRAALFEPPLANVGRVEALFGPSEIEDLLALTRLAA